MTWLHCKTFQDKVSNFVLKGLAMKLLLPSSDAHCCGAMQAS